MPNSQITIRTRDGDCPLHIATPAEDGPWPAVIFYMDAGGIRPVVIEMAQRLADAGYIVLLPDLFYRYGPLRAVGAQGGVRVRLPRDSRADDGHNRQR